MFTPSATARTAAGLARLAVRRPRLFAQLALAGLRDRKAMLRLWRLPVDAAAVRASPLFDEEWYLLNHMGVAGSGLSPELHCLLDTVPNGRWTSQHFSADAYLALNPEVRDSGVHPLAHWELYGRFIGCPASALDLAGSAPPCPAGAVEREFFLEEVFPKSHRTAVYATWSPNGRLGDADIAYVRALRDVCDNIVVFCNAPLFPDEAERLRGVASALACQAHGGYDFGSYRLGMALARKRGWLARESCRELVFANSSCYAPVHPFSRMFASMERRDADFWGITFNTQRSGAPHLQSFFLVFRQAVIAARALDAFFEARPLRATRNEAIERYEIRLTDFLRDAGFKPDAYVRPWFPHLHEFNPTTRPLTLMRRHGVPLVKVKALRGETSQPPEKVLAYVRRANPKLGAMIRVSEPPSPAMQSKSEAAAARARLAAKIAGRVRDGARIRVLFPVSSASMFPARPLFEAMLGEASFDPRLVVIPDLRWPGRDPVLAMETCERELAAKWPERMLAPLRPDSAGDWPDAFAEFDLVVYPSPYEFSYWRYNPMNADASGVLGLHVAYGFYRSVYDHSILALESYGRFWKVFAECPLLMDEILAHATGGGTNAELVGYVKMDSLTAAKPWPRNGNRKRVLIAPHHSVEGGANDTLALSNFQRYADYFLLLPEKHPEIDFVFRPHPFLFTVLSRKDKWGQAKVDDWIARMKAHENVRWSDEGDYFPVFASCDAAIQDCGSYLVEWFYTGKPCCYMLKDPADIDAKFAPLGKECLEHCYIAYDEQAIESFLRDVVECGNDPKAAARDEFRKSIMVNYPYAAKAALLGIKKALNIV